MNRLLLELRNTLFYQMEENALHGFRHAIEQNMAGRVILDPKSFEHPTGSYILFTEGLKKMMQKEVKSNDYVSSGGKWALQDMAESLAEDDRFIHLIYIQGAITREGGACSYGSQDIRDIMKKAASIPQCIKQVVVINSPGGVCGAEIDFQEGVDAAHEAGQTVDAFVSLRAASMAYNFACRCDSIWVANPEYEVGCIGTLISGYFMEDGTVNNITGEKYVEMYADQSTDKNYMFRELAAGNREPMQQELNRLCQEFMDTVKKNRPNCTEEQLKGKMFPAREVVGSMVDRIGTLEELVMETFGTATEPAEPAEPEGDPQDPQPENPNTNEMNTERLAKACGVETLEAMDGQVSLNEQLLEAIDGTLQQHEEQVQNLNQSITEKDQKIAEQEQTITELNAKAEELDQLNAKIAEQTQAAEALNTQITELQQQLQQAQTTLTEKETALTEKETAMTGLQQQLTETQGKLEQAQKDIEEMSHEANEPQKPAAPVDNNTQEPSEPEDNCQIINKPGMTAYEIAEREKKRMEYLRNHV